MDSLVLLAIVHRSGCRKRDEGVKLLNTYKTLDTSERCQHLKQNIC